METTPYNKMTHFDREEREQIVFHRHYDPKVYERGYGISRFKDLPLNVIKRLIEEGYLDPNDYQNSSPTVSSIVKFVEEHDPANWRFHGYVVSAERDDTRVSIEGINSLKPLGKDDLIDFLQEFRYADEMEAGQDRPVYCWYD